MSGRLVLFTLAAFLLFMGAIAMPVPSQAETSNMSSLARRITHDGRGTFFYPGEGNCGEYNDSNDPIIAVSTQIYNNGKNCNQWVEITNTENNKKTYGLVRDSCPSCSAGSLDMSPAVFEKLASLDEGVIPIKWHYMNRGFSP